MVENRSPSATQAKTEINSLSHSSVWSSIARLPSGSLARQASRMKLRVASSENTSGSFDSAIRCGLMTKKASRTRLISASVAAIR